jgi:hypothetical protein
MKIGRKLTRFLVLHGNEQFASNEGKKHMGLTPAA